MFRFYFLLLAVCMCNTVYSQLTYRVMSIREQITIDGKWDKPVWEKVTAGKDREQDGRGTSIPSLNGGEGTL